MLEKNNTDIEDIVINMLSGEKLSPEEREELKRKLEELEKRNDEEADE